MSDTVFVNGVTLSDQDWFNDVNRLHYTILGDPANLAAIRTTLAASDSAAGTLEVAIKLEMETPTSTTLAVSPGRTQYHPGVAKGWVTCNAAGGLNLGHNCIGVSDTDVGSVLITWVTDFSTSNYVPVVTIEEAGATILTAFVGSHAAGTTAITCVTNDAAPVVADPDAYFIVAFGHQP